MKQSDICPGAVFGRLTVVKQVEKPEGATASSRFWECRCECGNIKIVSGNMLAQGKTQSCGCLAQEERKARGIDITGQRFGKLVVIKKVPKPSHLKSNGAYFLCKCDCGNEKVIMGKSLRSGKTTSCGCKVSESARKDIVGQRFGKLVVVRYYGVSQSKNAHALWECICDCGRNCIVDSNSLKSGHTVSCGCLSSKGEEKIKKILIENGIIFEQQYSFSDLKNKGLLRFDFAIFENGVLTRLCEFDGVQHYIPNSKFFDEDIKIRDELKNQYCLDNNIPLIRIPYYHLENITIEDILSDKWNILKGDS